MKVETGRAGDREGRAKPTLAAVDREAPGTAALLLAALGLAAALWWELDTGQRCFGCVCAPVVRPTYTPKSSRAFSATPHRNQ